MDQYGNLDFDMDAMDYLSNALGDDQAVDELLFGGLMLQSGPTGAGAGAGPSHAVPVSGICTSDSVYFHGETSHHHQQELNVLSEDLPTWLGHDPRHDLVPQQDVAPFISDLPFPVDAGYAPPIAAAYPPPSLEINDRDVMDSNFNSSYAGLPTTGVTLFGTTSIVYPSVRLPDSSLQPYSGGVESTAGIRATGGYEATAGITATAAGEMAGGAAQTANFSVTASSSTNKAADDRKRKGKWKVEIIELDDDDSEIREIKTPVPKKKTPKQSRSGKKRKRVPAKHNEIEKRRRHKTNELLNAIFDKTPDCGKGNKTDNLDKVLQNVTSITEENRTLRSRLQIYEPAGLPSVVIHRCGMPTPTTADPGPSMPPTLPTPPICQLPPIIFPAYDPQDYDRMLGAMQQLRLHSNIYRGMAPAQDPAQARDQAQHMIRDAPQPGEPDGGLDDQGNPENYQSG